MTTTLNTEPNLPAPDDFYDELIGNRPDFLHGVCIVRDPRDVIASFFHYTKTQRFRSARPEYHYETVEERSASTRPRQVDSPATFAAPPR